MSAAYQGFRAASVQKQSGGVNRTCADQKPLETPVRPKQVIMLSTCNFLDLRIVLFQALGTALRISQQSGICHEQHVVFDSH